MIITVIDTQNKKEIMEQIDGDVNYDGFNKSALYLESLKELLLIEQEETLGLI